jgi:Cu(I)/Ag(I) efflux system periplasmic protein CusF
MGRKGGTGWISRWPPRRKSISRFTCPPQARAGWRAACIAAGWQTRPKLLVAAATIAAIAGSGIALAQSAPMMKGTVEKVDASAEKITINHEQIPNLNMEDGMSMVFRAADKAMLKQVKAGDKVQLSADRVNAQITVTKIQKAK